MRTFACLLVVAACGGGGIGTDAPGSGGKSVFVTQADFLANFSSSTSTDGAVQADTQCTSAANGAGISGTFHAWMSRFGGNGFPAATALQRVTGDGPWVSTGPDHTMIFLNRASLANTPADGIFYNEHGALASLGAPVWTGTQVGGTLGTMDCNQWRSADSSQAATVGRLGSTSSEWTDTGTPQPCSERAHLYCLQM